MFHDAPPSHATTTPGPRRFTSLGRVATWIVTLLLAVGCGGGDGALPDAATQGDVAPDGAPADVPAAPDIASDDIASDDIAPDDIASDDIAPDAAADAPGDGSTDVVYPDAAPPSDVPEEDDVLDPGEAAEALEWWRRAEGVDEQRVSDVEAILWGGEGSGTWRVEGEAPVVFEGDGFTVRAGTVQVFPVPPESEGTGFARREGALVARGGLRGCRFEAEGATLTVSGPGYDLAAGGVQERTASHTFTGYALEAELQAHLDATSSVMDPDTVAATCLSAGVPLYFDATILSVMDSYSRQALREGGASAPETTSVVSGGSLTGDLSTVACCTDGTIRVNRRQVSARAAEADLIERTGGDALCWWFEPEPTEHCTRPCSPDDCREGFCDDDEDNDRDGSVDCDDGDCEGASCGQACTCGGPEDCVDGRDNDGDEDADCADADCEGMSCGNGCECRDGRKAEIECRGGQDEDDDGFVDCSDADCDGQACADHGKVCRLADSACVCPTGDIERCANGADDDCDGQPDCADPDCAGRVCDTAGRVCDGGVCACSETTEAACADGVDEDCDGATDCADADCEGVACGDEQDCARPVCQGGACELDTDSYDGEPCDDEDACTGDDACSEGICRGGTPTTVCGDTGTTCRPVSCQPDTGACEAVDAPAGTPCDDGDPCSEADACAAGSCVPGAPKDCGEAGACESVACDTATGECVTTPAPDETPCDDGNPCTEGDACSLGECVSGTEKVCGIRTACSAPACDPATGGCVENFAEDGTPCDDGDRCTTGDECFAGSCQPGDRQPLDSPEQDCGDGVDDDCDGDTDCADSDCPPVWCCVDGLLDVAAADCVADCEAMGGVVSLDEGCRPGSCSPGEDACPCPDDAGEPNDDYATATPIGLTGGGGGDATGSVDAVLCPGTYPHAPDVWSFQAFVGDTFEAVLTQTGGRAIDGEPNLTYTLPRLDGPSSGAAVDPAGEGAWRLVYSRPLATTDLEDPDSGDVAVWLSEPRRFAYRLDVTVHRCPEDGLEPNDDAATRTTVSAGQSVAGYQCADDPDWFGFDDVPVDQRLRVQVDYDPDETEYLRGWTVTAYVDPDRVVYSAGSTSPLADPSGTAVFYVTNSGNEPLTNVRMVLRTSPIDSTNGGYTLSSRLEPAP